MKITCIKQICNETVMLLPIQEDVPIDDENFVLLMGYTKECEITEYHIRVGSEYTVYGILVYVGQIRYLIQDDDGIPVFCPEELFQIRYANVYWDWEIKSYLVAGKPLFLIGYPAMEGTYGDLIALVTRRESAIKRFLMYKQHTELYDNMLK